MLPVLQVCSCPPSLASGGQTQHLSIPDEQQSGSPAAAAQHAALSPGLADAVSTTASPQEAACAAVQKQGAVTAQQHLPGLEGLRSQLQVQPVSNSQYNSQTDRCTLNAMPSLAHGDEN